jgi:hypothetical protein
VGGLAQDCEPGPGWAPRRLKRNLMPTKSGAAATMRLGDWLVGDQDALESWLEDFSRAVESKEDITLHPVIKEFHALIERDPIVRMYLTEMIRSIGRVIVRSWRSRWKPRRLIFFRSPTTSVYRRS